MKVSFFAAMLVLSLGLLAEDAMLKWDFNGAISGLKLVREEENCTSFVEGLSGKAIYIGGGYKASKAGGAVANIEPETFAKPFSIDAWIMLDANVEHNHFRDIFGNCGDRGPGFRLTYYYNRLRVISGDAKEVKIAVVDTKVIVPKKEWFYIAMTYNGSELRIYLNGKEVHRQEFMLTVGKKMFTLGSFKGGMAYPLRGAMDNVRVYGRALDLTEIVGIYEKEIIR